MRQSSRTVLTSCHAPLGQAKKYVAVQLLTKETLYCVVEVKSKIQQVLDQLGTYLGIKDICLFGLAFVADDEYRFVNQNTKVSKVAPKQWKSLNNTGLDGTGKPLVTFLLRIQFYVDCHLFIRDKVTRTHYYLQLRENVLKHSQSSLEEHYFLLCAYALQADIGNYSQDKYPGQYFEPKDYFPAWVLERIGVDYIIQNIPAMHKDNHGLSRSEAQTAFIGQASSADAPHNLHLYQLLKKKNDHKSSVWLGICPKGIEIYETKNGCVKQLWSTFLWTNITKLYFEKKKFEIRAMSYSNTRKYTYYAVNDEKAKYLLHLCKMTHQFSMAMQPKVAELLQLEREAKKSYRESYIYSDSLDLEWEQEHGALNMSLRDFSTLPKAGKTLSDQRISVISNASSNTTSGIVSDKVQSLDGSEDDLEEIEIMINSPPAPSLESLSQLDSEDFEAQYNIRGSRQGLELQHIELNAGPAVEATSLPSATHSKTSSNAVSRTDSSSSQHSASTVKSRHHQNNTNIVNIDEIETDGMASAVIPPSVTDFPSSVYFLPKIEPVSEFWSSTPARINHHFSSGSDTSESSYALQKEGSPVQVTFASAQKINPMQSATVQVCHPKPATSRILTSVGVQIPVIQPPNWNLPHARTKIGVSSLSRPSTAGACRPMTYLHGTQNSLTTNPVRRGGYQTSIQNNSLPTPLYHRYYDYNSSRGRSNSDDSFLINKPIFNHPQISFSATQFDSFSSSIDGSDFQYIPPPPLYANPKMPSFPTNNGVTFELNNRVVQRARSEESCNSLEALMAQHNVNVGRAQSMDRRPKSEIFPYLLAPPPSYGSKYRLEDKERLGILNSRTEPLDIDNLRRRSKDLDLPLISALCNDRSLISPIAASLNSRRRSSETPKQGITAIAHTRPLSWHVSSEVQHPLTIPSSSQWSLSPIPTLIKSFGKTALSPKSSPVNTLQGGPQLFPLKLSVSGQSNATPRSSKLNGIDISVA